MASSRSITGASRANSTSAWPWVRALGLTPRRRVTRSIVGRSEPWHAGAHTSGIVVIDKSESRVRRAELGGAFWSRPRATFWHARRRVPGPRTAEEGRQGRCGAVSPCTEHVFENAVAEYPVGPMPDFRLVADFRPTGDQPQAIEKLADGLARGVPPPDAPRGDRHRQDGDDRVDHREAPASDAGAGPQQDARGPALQRASGSSSRTTPSSTSSATSTTTSRRRTCPAATPTSRRTRPATTRSTSCGTRRRTRSSSDAT